MTGGCVNAGQGRTSGIDPSCGGQSARGKHHHRLSREVRFRSKMAAAADDVSDRVRTAKELVRSGRCKGGERTLTCKRALPGGLRLLVRTARAHVVTGKVREVEG